MQNDFEYSLQYDFNLVCSAIYFSLQCDLFILPCPFWATVAFDSYSINIFVIFNTESAPFLSLTFALKVVSGKDLTPVHKKAYCVWYGQCIQGLKTKNCPYNGPAKNVTDPDAMKIIEELCPKFKGGPTWCDVKQLKTLTTNIQVLKKSVGHCPACWDNIGRLYCMSTCSPDQSIFMDLKTILGFPPEQWIEDVQYFVSPRYKQGLFDSCKNVIFLGHKDKVLSWICGTTAEKCNPQKLLDYLGNPSNGMTPFTMEYPQIILLRERN